MSNLSINQITMEKVVCRLTCGENRGTAFLVSKNCAITARHCIAELENGKPIILEFLKIANKIIFREARVIGELTDNCPIVLLMIDEPLECLSDDICCVDTTPEPLSLIKFYGYPNVKNTGIWLEGKIANVQIQNQYTAGDWNIDITVLDSQIEDFKGCSGSPLWHEGRLIGVVGEQTAANKKAITVNAVSISRIRAYLEQHGISVIPIQSQPAQVRAIGEQYEVLNTAMIRDIEYLSRTNQELKTGILSLLDKEYNEILLLRQRGAINQAWEKLNSIIEGEAAGKNNIDYAQFFYLAALWATEERLEKAKVYFETACELDINLDTRLYLSVMHEVNNDVSAAGTVLEPINTTTMLNRLLLLENTYKSHYDVSETLDRYPNIPRSEGTHQVITYHYLRTGDLIRAREYFNQHIEKREDSCVYWNLSGLILYWEAVSRHVKDVPMDSLVFATDKFVLDEQESYYAEEALLHYKKSLDLSDLYKNIVVKFSSLSALLSIYWILNREELASEYASKILSEDKGNTYAILFFIHHKNFTENHINALEQRVKIDPSAAIIYIRHLITQQNYQKASEVMAEYNDMIRQADHREWTSLNIEIKVHTNDVAGAYALLNSGGHKDNERLKLYIMQFDKNKQPRSIIKYAEKLKKRYGHAMDFQNLCNVYSSHGKWNKVLRTSKEWHIKYPDASSLFFQSKALYNLGSYRDCLDALDQIVKIHDLTDNQIELKVACLTSLSKLSDVLNLINATGVTTEKMVVLKAKIHISMGKISEAISTLRVHVDNSPESLEAAQLLVGLLDTASPKDAWDEIYQLHKRNSDNIGITLKAMHSGFHSGNDEKAGGLLATVMQSDYQQNGMRLVDMNEFMKIQQEYTQNTNRLNQEYLNTKLPIHAMFDKPNASMGYFFYSAWFHNSGIPLLWAFGGKEVQNLRKVINDAVILDYTACLAIFCLDLFPMVEKAFANILVSPNLMQCILHDKKHTVNPLQESVRVGYEVILSFFDRNPSSIEIFEDAHITDISFAEAPHDSIMYYAAIEKDALIVTNQFSTELLYQKPPPAALKDLQLYESELWKILREMGLTKYNPSGPEPRDETIHVFLNEQRPLLISTHLLEELLRNTIIQDVTSFFSLVVIKHDIQVIERSILNDKIGRQCWEWLDKLQRKLTELISSQKISFCPVAPKTLDEHPRFSVLADSMMHAMKEGIPLWAEDRLIHSYPSVGNSIIFGSYDFVQTLYENNDLQFVEYKKIVSELINKKVYFHVYSEAYVLSCLKIAHVREGKKLKENESLKKLRRAVAAALTTTSQIGKERLPHYIASELQCYIVQLQRLFGKLIVAIWNEPSLDDSWKEAASNWVLAHMSDFTCDIKLRDEDNIDIAISLKHYGLLHNIFIFDHNFRASYAKWILGRLYSYWFFFPEDKERVAHNIALSICADYPMAKKTLNMDAYTFATFLLEMFQRVLPSDLFSLVLQDPLCVERWGDDYVYKEVQVPQASIPSHDESYQAFDPSCDFVSVLYNEPFLWLDVVAAIMKYADGNSLQAFIDFVKDFILKYSTDKLPEDMKDFIVDMIWYAPSVNRYELQELRRMIG